jgi:hypothetical protein
VVQETTKGHSAQAAPWSKPQHTRHHHVASGGPPRRRQLRLIRPALPGSTTVFDMWPAGTSPAQIARAHFSMVCSPEVVGSGGREAATGIKKEDGLSGM